MRPFQVKLHLQDARLVSGGRQSIGRHGSPLSQVISIHQPRLLWQDLDRVEIDMILDVAVISHAEFAVLVEGIPVSSTNLVKKILITLIRLVGETISAQPDLEMVETIVISREKVSRSLVRRGVVFSSRSEGRMALVPEKQRSCLPHSPCSAPAALRAGLPQCPR